MDRDLSQSRAILIGNAAYRSESKIPDLPGAVASVAAMKGLLTGDLCGWPADRIETFVDVVAPHDLARMIEYAVRGVQGVVLLYYVGHGLRTSKGQLALTVGDSDGDPALLSHTALMYESVADILRGCPAATKLVMLDCCHAELANRANYILQSADIAEAYPVDGLYFLGASKTHEKAKAPLDDSPTYFTGNLISTIEQGVPGRPALLTLDQIFVALRDRMVRQGLPEPVESGARDARRFPFARNAAPPEVHIDYEAEYKRLREQLAARAEAATEAEEVSHTEPSPEAEVGVPDNRPTETQDPGTDGNSPIEQVDKQAALPNTTPLISTVPYAPLALPSPSTPLATVPASREALSWQHPIGVPGPGVTEHPAGKRRKKSLIVVGVVSLVLAGAVFGAYQWTQSKYYVGVSPDGRQVVVYQGISQMSFLSSMTPTLGDPVYISQVPLTLQVKVKENHTFSSESDALATVNSYRQAAQECSDFRKSQQHVQSPTTTLSTPASFSAPSAPPSSTPSNSPKSSGSPKSSDVTPSSPSATDMTMAQVCAGAADGPG